MHNSVASDDSHRQDDPLPPAAPEAIRLLIVDDHRLVLSALERLLSSEEDLEVVGTATTLREGVGLAQALRPDVVLLDVRMPDGDGINVVGDFASLDARVLMLTAEIDDDRRAAALQNGASAVVLKDVQATHLTHGIRAVARGGRWDGQRFPPRRGPQSPGGQVPTAAAKGLTPRERDVLASVGEGCPNREIARRLGISEDTVKHHMSSLFDKTGTANRLQLLLYAAKRRLIS